MLRTIVQSTLIIISERESHKVPLSEQRHHLTLCPRVSAMLLSW